MNVQSHLGHRLHMLDHICLSFLRRGRGVGPPPPPRGALVRGAPVRGAIARGAAVARGVPPLPAVRGAPTPRARAAGIQRIPLPPPPAPEAYEDYVRNVECLHHLYVNHAYPSLSG